MKNRDSFSGFHPVVNFVYFGLVLIFSMVCMHPVSLVISFSGAFCYALKTGGGKICATLKFIIPSMLLSGIINPAFNHKGITVIKYLPGGNPLTLESILYGVAAAFLLAGALLWFFSFNTVMTSDKLLYLFGKIIPSLSLVLSMGLRFVPRFKDKFSEVADAQSLIGKSIKSGSVFRRLKNAASVLSVMIAWALQNAIETADSMKSRGYTLHGRTFYSIFNFSDRDKKVFLWLIFCGLYITSGIFAGGFDFQYFPYVKAGELNIFTVSFFIIFLSLVFTPIIIDIKEEHEWRSSISEI